MTWTITSPRSTTIQSAAASFNAQRQHAGGAGLLNHVVGDRHHMTRGGAGADNHAIGDAGFAMYINGNDVLTFQVINFVDNKITECFTLQVFPTGA